MKKQFSKSECENIMKQCLKWHDETCVSMYQNINFRHILIVETTTSGGIEINEMQKMNLSVSLFAQNYHIQMYLSKK